MNITISHRPEGQCKILNTCLVKLYFASSGAVFRMGTATPASESEPASGMASGNFPIRRRDAARPLI